MIWSLSQPKRWLLRRSREGAIGLALLALCLMFDLALLGPAYEHLEQLRRDIALADTPVNQSAKVPDPEALATQQLTRYYGQFPPQSSTPDWLNKIYKAAATHQIQLIQGEYRVQLSENGKVVHYHIAMPVKGTYTQIRHFIATVLANVPNASLDHVSFEREKIEESTIEAKVTFTLYLMVTS